MNSSTTIASTTGVSSECLTLKILDIPYYHPCFNWTNSEVATIQRCEIEYPCEVRQYLYSMSTFIAVTRCFLSYGTVFIILLGLFLNSLSFYTFVSSGLSKSGSGIYLMSLAVCDCGNLIFNYAVGVARGHIIQFNALFMNDEWLCRAHAVSVEVFQLISAWIVVSFTVERCVAIWYPMIMRNCSRVKRAKIVVASLCVGLTLFALPKLFLTEFGLGYIGFEGDSVYGYPPCSSKRYQWQGVAYVSVAFQTWIPTVAVFIFNLLMFYKLQRVKKVRKQLTTHKRSGANPKLGDTSRKRSFINRPSKTAPMLIAVSLTYLILVFPVGIVQTVELVWDIHNKPPAYNGWEDDGGIARQRYVEWKTTKLLLKNIRSFCFGFYQINFAINFFLYFAAGLQFRLHLQHKCKEGLKYFGLCGGLSKLSKNNPSQRNTSMTMSTTLPPGSGKSSPRRVRISGCPPSSLNVMNNGSQSTLEQIAEEIPMEEIRSA